MLAGRSGTDDLVLRGARVLDPVEGVDGMLDVRIDGGVITGLGERLDGNEHRVIDATGLTLAPAFVDPHVEGRVEAPDRIEQACAADDDVVCACAPGEHHATSTVASTATGPVVSRS